MTAIATVGKIVAHKFPAVFYMVFIFYLSSRPLNDQIMPALPDYLLHAVEYCILYVLLFFALVAGTRESIRKRRTWAAVFIAIAYGFLDEYHQSFVPSRHASISDVLADMAGVVIGFFVVQTFVTSSRMRERTLD